MPIRVVTPESYENERMSVFGKFLNGGDRPYLGHLSPAHASDR
ncbi:hypothetical protein SAMN05428984_1120 [Sphingomonas sp. OK281]|nr:hypothetical protein SAMN05428984_1120 [Sphingomonas sp. OK281]